MLHGSTPFARTARTVVLRTRVGSSARPPGALVPRPRAPSAPHVVPGHRTRSSARHSFSHFPLHGRFPASSRTPVVLELLLLFTLRGFQRPCVYLACLSSTAPSLESSREMALSIAAKRPSRCACRPPSKAPRALPAAVSTPAAVAPPAAADRASAGGIGVPGMLLLDGAGCAVLVAWRGSSDGFSGFTSDALTEWP